MRLSNSSIRYISPIVFLITIFLLIKIQSLGIRASDTSIYFYTAKELLSGKALYRDIFFTNFPVVPYIAAFYYLMSGGNLLFYFFTATIEVIITGALIYYLTLKKTSSILSSTLAASLYLFSFLILATSDHQSGVFLAGLLSITSYIFFTHKKLLLAGCFAALALLTKAYTLPFALSLLFIIIIHHGKYTYKFIIGGVTTALIVLLPTIISGPITMWHNVFEYSLTRSQGISKLEIMWFTIQHDFPHFLLLLISILRIKKYLFYGVFAIFSVLFLIAYKDIYYLYLAVTIPFLCLFFGETINELIKKYSLSPMMVPTILIFFIGYNLISYLGGYNRLQVLFQLPEMLQLIQTEKPKALYGVNGITPALAYLSNIPLLNDIVDTNDNIFRKGYLSAKSLTHEAISQHALVITQGVWYPEAGIKEDILTDAVVKKSIYKNCSLKKHFNFYSEGSTNIIAFYRC